MKKGLLRGERGDRPVSPEAVACRLRDLLIERLGSDVAAIWLYGATTFGHPAIDVDLHIVLERQLTPDEWNAVRTIHDHLVEMSSFPHEDLDFWYILLSDAKGSSNPRHLAPWANGLMDEHWALHRAHWLAGQRKIIHGPDPENIAQPPTWQQLESTLRRELERPAPSDPSPYWVLQLVRVWASLETRDVVRSKLDSAAWALERLPREYHAIVEAATRFYRRSFKSGDERLIADAFPMFLEEIKRRVRSNS